MEHRCECFTSHSTGMAARAVQAVTVLGGLGAAAFTARECAAHASKAGTVLCIPCAFAAAALVAGAGGAYVSSEGFADSVRDRDAAAAARGDANAAAIKAREDARFQAADAEIRAERRRRRDEAARLDRYVDPRTRH